MKSPANWLHTLSEYFTSSISNKIIIPYALLTALLAVFGVFVVTNLVAGTFEERLKNQLLEAGRVVSDEVVNRERFRLEVQRAVANTVGVANALAERDLRTLEALVSPIIANSQGIDAIIITNQQGKEVLRVQRSSASPNASAQSLLDGNANFVGWMAVARVLADPQGEIKEAQLAQDPNSKEMLVFTVGPVRRDNQVVGAVLVGTYLQKELTLLRGLALAETTLFDENGKVLATTFPFTQAEAQEIFRQFTPARYRQVVQAQAVTLLDQVEGVTDFENRGQAYRMAYAPFVLRSRVYGVYGVALPTSFITDTNDQSRTQLALIFSLGVVAVFLVGYGIARRIIRPIIRLVQTSQAISSGDLSRRSGLDSKDEIGVLAKTFDHMTTELQRLLRIQQEEASKLNAILNGIADGVIVQDVDGQALAMNPAARAILDQVGADLSSTRLKTDELPLAEPAERSRQWLQKLTGLQFHETRRFEVGRQVLSALSAPVFTPTGEQLGTVVVLRDITREVESEKLKDDFITSVSHELRTPLTAIKGYNDLLRMTAADRLTDQHLQFIATVDENVADLLGLIQEMLDLSQIDAGALGIDSEPINLAELITAEADHWQEKMQEKELTLTTRLTAEPVWVEGDWARLSRVLHNLLSNAYEYTRPGGSVEVWLKQENGHAQVDVKDNGVGIAQEAQRYLFTRFFRAIHEESTYDVSGAGLGLYLSKAIIEAHPGGKIWVKTEPNQGSTFSFTLPVADPTSTETLPNKNAMQSGA